MALQVMVGLSMPLLEVTSVWEDCVHPASHMPEHLYFESTLYVIYTVFILAPYSTDESKQDFFLKDIMLYR